MTSLVLLVIAFVFGYLLLAQKRSAEETRVFNIVAPGDTTSIETITVSPNGRYVAIVAGGRLWIRPINSLSAIAVDASVDARFPFWALDSGAIGYFADGKLKRVSVHGNLPQTLAAAPEGTGGAWSPAGFIVFSTFGSPLLRVSASGGEVTHLSSLVPGQVAHYRPVLLQNGRLLYSADGTPETSGVFITRFSADDRLASPAHRLFSGGVALDCTPTADKKICVMLFRRGGLFAQQFDLAQMQLVGTASEVRLPGDSAQGQAISVSRNGIAVFEPNARWVNAVLSLERTGQPKATIAQPAQQINLGLAPDGTQLLVTRKAEDLDIWAHDLKRGTVARLTSHPAADGVPVWHPNGSRVAFASVRDGSSNVYIKDVHALSPERPPLVSATRKYPTDWSADGRWLMFEVVSGDTGWDLWVLPGASDERPKSPEVYLRTEFSERDGQFSPDGRWVAFTSNESGRDEVYIQSFPAGRGKWQISTNGGGKPVWRRDGRELYYISSERYLVVVPVTTEPSFTAADPNRLFAVSASTVQLGAQYAVDARGETFVVLSPVIGAKENAATVIVNWRPELIDRQ